MTTNQKLVVANAVVAGIGGFLGRKYVWKYTSKLVEPVMPGYAKWMQECPMWQAVLAPAVTAAVIQHISNEVLDKIKDK